MNTTLIIGASSGIGQALSQQLLDKGERVIALSRTRPQIEPSVYYPYDASSDDELPVIEESFNGLVYCPGSIVLKPFKSIKPQDFEQELKLNVLGAIKAVQGYLPQLSSSSGASIVLFSTVAVQTGMPFHTAVSVSKGAIEGLVKALAAELSPKIRVNAIAPSLTQTTMAQKLTSTPEKIEAIAQKHPLKRIGQPEDIANMARFLLSAESSWITGQIIGVDGGMSNLKL